MLGSILAEDGYMPKALGARGDRLAYSNGIVFLAAVSIALVVAFDARTTQLIQLYIVGVFVSFTLGQLGMVRHWTRELSATRVAADRRPDAPVPGDRRRRPGAHRRGAGGGAGDQVPARAPGSRCSRWPASSC